MSYPVVLNVKGKRCLVVGGGKVGSRKAHGLLAEGAQVTVLSSSFAEQLDGVTYIQARYDRQSMQDVAPWLVITATDDPATNAQIQQDANALGAIVIRADDSQAGDAHGLMKRELGGITFTASSGVPILSRYILDTVEDTLSPNLVHAAAQLTAIREDLKTRISDAEQRTAIWQAIAEHLPNWLAADTLPDLYNEVESIIRQKYTG